MSSVGNFWKNNAQFLYSLLLIIMIPVLIIANTLWQIRASQENMNYELQQKALLAENIVGSAFTDNLDNTRLLQSKISQMMKENGEIQEITILQQTADGFVAVASSNPQFLGVKFSSTDYVTAWTQNNPTAMLVNDTTKTPNERMWSVTSPLTDISTGQKVAMINMKVTLSDIDALTKKNLNLSLIFLVVTIFFVLLLLINHFRFFEYSILFKRLKEVDKMKDDFISIASHELKTPMAAIKGYISMLMEGIAGKIDDKAKDHLLKIDSNVKRLDTLVSETLDVSRLEQGRMQFDLQPIDITTVVDKTMTAYKDQADSKGIYLKEEKPQEPLPQIFADPDRLQQVFDNIIGNAIKYTRKGGVTIYYKIEAGNILTYIKDSGIGMSAVDRKQLFNKFYRIKTEKTADIPGTGLGLWIAREITRKMQGDILVDSMENVGSQFTMTIPYIKEKKWS